jgi:hypothetical protein
MHRVIAGCETMYFWHVGFGCLLGCDGQCGGGGEASRGEGVHQYVADDALTDEHHRNHPEPAAIRMMRDNPCGLYLAIPCPISVPRVLHEVHSCALVCRASLKINEVRVERFAFVNS